MTRILLFVSAGAALAIAAPAQAAGPTDPQIAHIAYTAGTSTSLRPSKRSRCHTTRPFAVSRRK